jgi:uncharacterized membrane protein (DUF485 family)
MPKSKVRKKENTFVREVENTTAHQLPDESPAWLPAIMVLGFVVGLGWIVTYYVSNTAYPIPGIAAWNMVIGFGFIALGFTLATKWR